MRNLLLRHFSCKNLVRKLLKRILNRGRASIQLITRVGQLLGRSLKHTTLLEHLLRGLKSNKAVLGYKSKIHN